MWSTTRFCYPYICIRFNLNIISKATYVVNDYDLFSNQDQLLRNSIYFLSKITLRHQARITLTLPHSFLSIPRPSSLLLLLSCKKRKRATLGSLAQGSCTYLRLYHLVCCKGGGSVGTFYNPEIGVVTTDPFHLYDPFCWGVQLSWLSGVRTVLYNVGHSSLSKSQPCLSVKLSELRIVLHTRSDMNTSHFAGCLGN